MLALARGDSLAGDLAALAVVGLLLAVAGWDPAALPRAVLSSSLSEAPSLASSSESSSIIIPSPGRRFIESSQSSDPIPSSSSEKSLSLSGSRSPWIVNLPYCAFSPGPVGIP